MTDLAKHTALPHDIVEATGYPPPPATPSLAGAPPLGAGESRRDYDPRLTNEDLAPLTEQKWRSYNIFAFWMSDVHSVGGYATAGALFALGMNAWQVFIALMVGIVIVQFFCNLVAKPSQQAGVPYPVTSRVSFGVLGANVAAIIRGCIAIAWFGVQTFLAAESLNIVFLKLFPGMQSWTQHEFLGLSAMGYLSYAILWAVQCLIFWRGMEVIRRFIDWAGPAVYVIMVALCIYMLVKAHWSISLSDIQRDGDGNKLPSLTGWPMIWALLAGVATTVSYFSGPMLNFGDFSRYAKDFRSVKRGNLLGLPVNFAFFSVLSVVTTAATLPVFGHLITDPIQTVNSIDTTFAILLGGLTFVTATVGINIVANFISPAFDFSNVNPQKISWRTGGMIAAVGSVLLTPWNWYANDDAIFWTLGLLGAMIGPLFGILIADFYLVRRQRIVVDDLYTLDPAGEYFYKKGYNPAALKAVIVGSALSFASVIVPKVSGEVPWLSKYSWFVGCGAGLVAYYAFALLANVAGVADRRAAGEPATEPSTAPAGA